MSSVCYCSDTDFLLNHGIILHSLEDLKAFYSNVHKSILLHTSPVSVEIYIFKTFFHFAPFQVSKFFFIHHDFRIWKFFWEYLSFWILKLKLFHINTFLVYIKTHFYEWREWNIFWSPYFKFFQPKICKIM
jgi:hypothetical protein